MKALLGTLVAAGVLSACQDGIVIPVEDIPEVTKKVAIAEVRGLDLSEEHFLARSPTKLYSLVKADDNGISIKNSLDQESDAWAIVGGEVIVTVKAGGRLATHRVGEDDQLTTLYESSFLYDDGYIDLSASGNHLALASEHGGITLFELASDGVPQEVAHFQLSGAHNTSSVFLSEDLLIVGSYVDETAGEGLISLLSLSSMAAPQLMAQLPVTYGKAASVRGEGLFAMQFHREENTLVVCVEKGLAFYDIANQTNPQLLRTMSLRKDPTAILYNSYISFGFHDDMEGELFIEGSSIATKLILQTKGRAYDAAFADNVFYIADGSNGMLAVDLNKIIELFKGIGGQLGDIIGGGGGTGPDEPDEEE